MEGAEEWRGPRLGDSASLWNFTPSPGWTKVEAAILRLLLMKHGVGRWVQILDSGLLPGKMIQQLNGQTQRLLGQQSLAAYTGLQVDLDRIRADNDARQEPEVERKSGLIIWSGPNPTKEMKTQWQIEAQHKYGLTEEQKLEVVRQLEEVAATLQRSKLETQPPPVDSIMLVDPATLGRQELLRLLGKLRAKLELVHARALLPLPKASVTAGQPLQDVSNGRQRQQAAGSKGGGSGGSRGSGGAKRSRTGSVKPARGPGDPRAKGSARGRRKQQEELDEAPLNAAAAEARAAAYECDLERLEGMGFSRHKAQEALDETNCDPDAAVEWLLINCV